MTETIIIPLSVLNNAPFLSGVDDVVFAVLTPDDLRDIVVDELPDEDLIEQAVERALENVLPPTLLSVLDLRDTIEAGVDAAVDLEDAVDLDVSEIAAELADEIPDPSLDDIEVDVGGSLFDIEQDFVDLLAEALSQADLGAVDDFPDLTTLQETLEGIQEDIQAIDTDTLLDSQQAFADAFESVLEGLPGGQLLTDPGQFIVQVLNQAAAILVSEEVLDDVNATIREVRQ